jgi:transcriptional regulator with XRE-family HTH domain
VDPEWSDFGEFLRATRLRQGLTQQSLAAVLGCQRIHIWRLEHGKRRPSITLLRLVAATLPVTSDEQAVLITYERLIRAKRDSLAG